MAHRTAYRGHPTLRRRHASIHLKGGVFEAQMQRDHSIQQVRTNTHRIMDAAVLRLQYGELYHTEAEVMRFASFCLAANRIDTALVVLEAWAGNPYRAVAS